MIYDIPMIYIINKKYSNQFVPPPHLEIGGPFAPPLLGVSSGGRGCGTSATARLPVCAGEP